jgi:endonuclease YncB( thermonuclease family)
VTCLAALCLVGALAVDGDTLRLDGQRYRLWGIDAPEMREPAGPGAKRALAGLIAGQPLACDWIDTDRYGRPVVRCDLPDGRDLSCAMAATGRATDWPRYSAGRYEGCG